MRKKVRFEVTTITPDSAEAQMRDVTIGGVYEGAITLEGDLDPECYTAVQDCISFFDDAGDLCTAWLSVFTYKVIER